MFAFLQRLFQTSRKVPRSVVALSALIFVSTTTFAQVNLNSLNNTVQGVQRTAGQVQGAYNQAQGAYSSFQSGNYGSALNAANQLSGGQLSGVSSTIGQVQGAYNQAQGAYNSLRSGNYGNVAGLVSQLSGGNINLQSLANNASVNQFRNLAGMLNGGNLNLGQLQSLFGDLNGLGSEILGGFDMTIEQLQTLLNKLKNDNEPREIIDEVTMALQEQDAIRLEFLQEFQAEQEAIVAQIQTAQQEATEAQQEVFNQLEQIGLQNAIDRNTNVQGSLGNLNQGEGGFDVNSISVGNEAQLELDPSSTDDSNLVNRILRYLIMITSTFGVLMLILGGYFMVTSQGDENRLQKGKNIFFYTVIGILVVFSSYGLIQFVLAVLFGGQ